MDWGVAEPRVVAVYPGGNRVLTGYQVADELVVTAAHHVTGSPRIRVSRSGDAHRFDAELAWGGGSDRFGEIDAVVLRVPGLPAVSGRVRWVSHVGTRPVACRMVGFPNVSASVAVDGVEPVAGAYLPGTGSDLGKLVLGVTSARPAVREGWQGLSGAAVRDANDRIMGLVIQHDDNRHRDTLTALPVTRLLAEPEVAELLGAPTVESVDADCLLVEPAARPLDVDSPSLSEFDLITARHQLVPYVKTTQDSHPLEELTAWCQDDTGGQARVLVRLVTGGAGAGKTRLAAELCQAVAGLGTGWAAGFATSDRAALADQLPKRPLLIVFDYTELNPDLARGFLERVIQTEHNGELPHPVRVVLVARSEGEWLNSLSANRGVKKLLRHCPPVALVGDDFGPVARLAHRDAAFERFTRPDMHPAASAVAPAVDGDGYDTPLMVQIAALLAAKGETLPDSDSDDLRAELLDSLIDREVSHLKDSLTDEPGIDRKDVRTALTIATLTTPTPDEAPGLFIVDKRWSHRHPDVQQRVADLIRTLHHGVTVEGQDGEERTPIAAIEPDLISEHLVATLTNRTPIITKLFTHKALIPEHRARLLSLLALTSDHYPEVRKDLKAHLASSLERLTNDPTAADSLRDLLVDRLPQLLKAAIEQMSLSNHTAAVELAVALDQFPQDLRISDAVAAVDLDVPHPTHYFGYLGVAYQQHKVNHLRHASNTSDLARSLNILATLLSEDRRRAEAVIMVQEAVGIYRRLADQDSVAHLPDLASTLSHLVALLAQDKRCGEALTIAQEAVDIYHGLLEQDQTTYLPGLAGSMFNLGLLNFERNDLVAAQAWYRKAAYAGNTSAMNNLGAMLRQQGDMLEAEKWFLKASNAGDVTAMLSLANLLHAHRGNPVEAERWYRESSQGGNIDAMYEFAQFLLRQDKRTEAEEWAMKVWEAGGPYWEYSTIKLAEERIRDRAQRRLSR